jgi:hypothetical protein
MDVAIDDLEFALGFGPGSGLIENIGHWRLSFSR